MHGSGDSKIGNIWLNALADDDRARLLPHLVCVPFERKNALALANQVPDQIYFPEGGIGSIVVEATDLPQTEVGIFGREGMSGVSALLGAGPSVNRTYVQIGGANAWQIPFAVMRAALAESATLRQSFGNYVHTMVTQLSYNVVANARYPLEARLARWLLMCHDRIEGDDIRLTHQFMAVMIGAQRTGVTVSLHALEGGGLIKSRRGLVTITDRGRMEKLAGNAYGVAESEYRRLIGGFGRGAARKG